jgi:tetratricopeptide (TPR) repeat protein
MNRSNPSVSRPLAALLGALLFVLPSTAGADKLPKVDDSDHEGETWTDRDYYLKDRDGTVALLVENVERNHFSRDNFWKQYDAGDYRSAQDNLRYALWVFPNHPKALQMMAAIAQKTQNYSLPIPYFEKAIILFPNYAFTRAQYGDYLVGIGKVNAGMAMLREALQVDPNCRSAQAWLAEAERTANQPKSEVTR